MNESSKILLYGLLASILLIAICLYTHEDEFSNEVKEVVFEPIEKVERKVDKKEEVVKERITVSKPILKQVLVEQVAEVNDTNETEVLKEEINASHVNKERGLFKNKEQITLMEHPTVEKAEKNVSMSDKNLPTDDNIPLIDNEKVDTKKVAIKTKVEDKTKKKFLKKEDSKLSIATAQEKILKIINRNISFHKNRATITSKGQRTLNSVVEVLKNVSNAKILVKGYTDAGGKEKINQWISEERAKSVKKYLVKHGIAIESIETKGYGESELLYGDKPYSKLNRRVEIELKKEVK